MKLPNANLYGPKITAIIFCSEKQVNGTQFLKYKFVDNTPRGLMMFERFAARFPGAEYINYYDRNTRAFIERHTINHKPPQP
jgi:hypothetical protein